MRKLFTLFFALIAASIIQAQAPSQIKYQGVARDAAGNAIVSGTIDVKFDIHDVTPLGTIIWTETHIGVTTNQFGLFSVNMGSGNPLTNVFNGGDEYLEVSVNFGSGIVSM